MKPQKIISPLLLLILAFGSACHSQEGQVDRQTAVAGSFYPASKDELDENLEKLFKTAKPRQTDNNVVAIISPHAGYVFSGEVAASAFNQIDPSKKYENIFILGSSHHVAFDGASVYSQGDFLTPLGTAKVNTVLANELIKKHIIFNNRTDAHAREHSIEVELPFLQYRLKKDFEIIPIVLGTQSPGTCRRIAGALKPYFNRNNLFIISTDFSHYPQYIDAVRVDKETAEAIVSNSSENLLHILAKCEQEPAENLATCLCGWTSVLTLLSMSEGNPDAAYSLIQYKNSGDAPIGEKDRVVGYCALAVLLKEKQDAAVLTFSDDEKRELLAIARNTITHYLQHQKMREIDPKKITPAMKTACGAFVTLKRNGELRGCIGRFISSEPLHRVVQEMAVASSTQDYRFKPVGPDEIKELEIEISVLTPMRRIDSIDEIELGRHGIYIKKGFRSGTFLPQVADETGWTKEEFLGHCAQDKAGIGWDGWKDAELYIYEALVFSEKELQIK